MLRAEIQPLFHLQHNKACGKDVGFFGETAQATMHQRDVILHAV